MSDSQFTPAFTYPLRALLNLSTAHLKPETLERLNRMEVGDLPFSGGITENGWFVYAPYDPENEVRPDCPEEIVSAMKKARELGADHILYDSGAAEDPDILPVFQH